jgi:hypothetical protein
LLDSLKKILVVILTDGLKVFFPPLNEDVGKMIQALTTSQSIRKSLYNPVTSLTGFSWKLAGWVGPKTFYKSIPLQHPDGFV